MALDPSIALQVKPMQIENPANQLAQIYQLSQAQQANQLNQIKMQEYQRESEDRNMLRGLDPASVDYINKLKRINPKLGFEAEKEFRLGQKAQTDAVGERIKLSRQALDGVQTPEQFLAWHQQNHADPILGEYLKSRGVTVEQSAAKIAEALKTPDGFQKLLIESKIGSEKALENHFQSQDLGGTSRVLTMPKYGSGSAQVVAGSVGTETLTPYQRKQLDLEGRRVSAAEKAVGEDVVAHQTTDAQGNVTNYNKFGKVISTVKNAGKPSATYEKTKVAKEQQVKDINQAIFELESATKEGGLIDQSTGSGIGRGVDIAAGMVGMAPEGAVALSKLKPIADIVLKMVPRFEGPQSDKDTQSYKEAAGQLADGTLPTKIRKQAGLEILRLMKNRKGQFATVGEEGNSSTGSWKDL